VQMSKPRGPPPNQELVASPEQEITLRQLLEQPGSSRSLAFCARIILECAGGANNAAVAAKLRTTGFTAGISRNRSTERVCPVTGVAWSDKIRIT